MATAVLFFLAGLLRGAAASANLPGKALLIGAGGALPAIAMRATGAGLTAWGSLPVFLATALSFVPAGIAARRLFARGRIRNAVLVTLVPLAIALLAAMSAIPYWVAKGSSRTVDRLAPAFSLTTLDEKPIASSDLRGHIVVLAFWATWCTPCRQELPELQQVVDRFKSDPKVAIWAVGVDSGEDTAEKQAAFARNLDLRIPLAFDRHGAAQALEIKGLPKIVILDDDGHVRVVHDGYDASEHLALHLSEQIAALEGSKNPS
jgi:peroxiredoxin